VPGAERIATFDNDGTLWSEQPAPVQLFFALDHLKALAPQHPEWNTKEPFASLLKGDLNTALAGGDRAILRAPAHHGVRQLGWRPADAGIYAARQRRALRVARAA
jgi:hypothetical protein